MKAVACLGSVLLVSGCYFGPPEPVPRQIGPDTYTVTASREAGSTEAGEVSLAIAARYCRARQRQLSVTRVSSSENALSNVQPSATVDFRCVPALR
jgi:hypothetical protein